MKPDNNKNDEQYDVPVLLIAFLKTNTTQKVFDEIRKIKPKQFFFAVDGPRENRPSDIALCQAVRDIVKQVDWDCDVKTLFREKNLGCGYGESGAMNWFFENVEYGIILEDDCLPSQSFFYFCKELLERYKDNEEIMHINGNNYQKGRKRGFASYYFSDWPYIWGWASWRRAWKHYDFKVVSEERRRSTWDWQWLVALRKQKGLAITPNVNLVSNIDFGEETTHTTILSQYSNILPKQIIFPLSHPKIIIQHRFADLYTYLNHFGGTYRGYVYDGILKTAPKSVGNFLKRLLGRKGSRFVLE